MRDAVFYAVTVLIWGTTWIAINFQLGVVDPVFSIAYRFLLAASILMLWCLARGLNLRFSLRNHLFLILQGAMLFALNYWLFYIATAHLTSGLVALLFSSIMAMNVINGALFLGSPVDLRVVLGGGLGLAGIALVFKPELAVFDFGDAAFTSILLCLAASYLASLGNIISLRNHRNQIPIVQGNAFAMSYGATIMLAIAFISGRHIAFDPRWEYMGSLFYLGFFGTVIAFGCYLTLVASIGADRAAYSTLLLPLVALVISTIWEGYHWSAYSITGLIMVLGGNLLIIKRPAPKPAPRAAVLEPEA